MKAVTQNLMIELNKIDCSFARYWDTDATSALEWTIVNAGGKTGRNLEVALRGASFSLDGRQEALLETLAEFDRTESRDLLYRLSDGQIKEIA